MGAIRPPKNRHMINRADNRRCRINIDAGGAACIDAPAPVLVQRRVQQLAQQGLDGACMRHDDDALLGKMLAELLPCQPDALRHVGQALAIAWGVVHWVGKTVLRIGGHALHHLCVGQAFPVAVVGLAPCLITHNIDGACTDDGFCGGLRASQTGVQHPINFAPRKETRQRRRLPLPKHRQQPIGMTQVATRQVPIGLAVSHQPYLSRDHTFILLSEY